MDKMKVYLKVLKKHHFWVLAGLLVIVSASVWSSATGQLETEFKANKNKIDTTTSQLTTIQENSPNATFTEKTKELEKNLRTRVFSSWQEMYKAQQPFLVWPAKTEAIGNVRDDFIRTWDARFPPPANTAVQPDVTGNGAAPPPPPLTPVEAVKHLKDLNTQTDATRRFYRDNVIREELNRLFNLVQVRTERRRPNVEGKAAPRPRDAQDAAEYDGIVYWDETQREALTKRYYRSDVEPSLGRIITTQEDLWILESLLRVIQNMNKGANDPLAAVVKRIDAIDVAQWAMKDAVADSGKIDTFGNNRLPIDTGSTGGPGGFDPNAAARTETEEDVWLNQRYLSEKMQPLNFNTPAPFAEFKQVYVRLKVLMDQRKAPELISACASARLPVEVRQVLMSLDDKTGTGQRPGGGQRGPTGDKIPPGPYDGLVDIRGIVYIYNKPDENKVGKGAAGDPSKRPFSIPTVAPETPTSSGGAASARPR